jgi:hypothetical protein
MIIFATSIELAKIIIPISYKVKNTPHLFQNHFPPGDKPFSLHFFISQSSAEVRFDSQIPPKSRLLTYLTYNLNKLAAFPLLLTHSITHNIILSRS